jgi:hypothetical protein
MPNYNEALKETFWNTIEQLASMFGESADDGDYPEPPEALQISMSFMGPRNGRFVMAVDKAVSPVLAANMYGTEPDDPKAGMRAQDALKELLNATCSSFLEKVIDKEPAFELSLPEIHVMDAERWEIMQKTPGTLLLLVEGYPVLLNMSVMH